MMKDNIMTQPKIKIKDLKALMKSELKLNVIPIICRTVKKKVMEQLMGDYRVDYANLHNYVLEIKISNPRTTCV